MLFQQIVRMPCLVVGLCLLVGYNNLKYLIGCDSKFAFLVRNTSKKYQCLSLRFVFCRMMLPNRKTFANACCITSITLKITFRSVSFLWITYVYTSMCKNIQARETIQSKTLNVDKGVERGIRKRPWPFGYWNSIISYYLLSKKCYSLSFELVKWNFITVFSP